MHGDPVKMKLILIASLLFLVPAPGSAQNLGGDTPGAVQRRDTDIREFYQLKRKLEGAKELRPEEGVTDRTKEGAPQAADGGQRIFISRIVTDRSDILADEELRAIVSPFEGKEVSIRELFAAVEKINDLYRNKGYLTARAILPPQKVEGGTIRIRLVEGRVGMISVEGNRHTWDWFFTSRLHFKEGDLVRLKTVEEDIFYFNATNDVKMRAEVKPGATTGTTDLILKAQEPDNYRVSLFMDNAGGRTVGQERIGLILQDISLFRMRDSLTLGTTLADGTTSGHASYNVPVTPMGTRLGLSFDYNHIRITSGAFESLNIEGDSSCVGLTLGQPLMVRSSLIVNGFAGFYWKKSTTDFDDVTIFQNRSRTLTAGGDLVSIDGYGTWFTRHAVTQGFRDFGGDRSFFKYNGDLVRTLNLPAELSALLRAGGQISGNNLLPSSEQYQVGGIATVRGFYEGLLAGDDGYFVSAELGFPLFPGDASLFDVRLRPLLKGALFVDHGGAFPSKGNNESINHNDFLTSAGVGFILNLSKYLTGRIDVAFPLVDREPDPGTVRVHFSLRSEIF
jgi:hemolysin activation/secretion protein